MVSQKIKDQIRLKTANSERRSCYIIIPMDWITEFEDGEAKLLTSRIDIRDVIKSITSVPIYLDYEQALYDELTERGVFDDADNELIGWFTFFLEIFVERLYKELALIIQPDDMDHYLFHSWVDNYSLMMVRNDVPDSASETMADRIEAAKAGFLTADYVV